MFFYFYCFLGWCIESAFVSVVQKRLVNRGFLHAPLLPIYGSGAIIILFATLAVRENAVLVFLFGAAAATVLEYFTGVAMERLFKVRYWDYSHKRWNFRGQICLSSTLAWGALSVVLIDFLHPPVERFITQKLPTALCIGAAVALSVLFIADFAVSFRDAWGLGRILEKMTALKAEVADLERRLRILQQEGQERREEYVQKLHALEENTLVWLSDFKNAKPQRLVDLKQAIDELTERLGAGRRDVLHEKLEKLRASYATMHLPRRFNGSILRRNPTAVSRKFSEALADYKRQISELRSHKNKK